MDAEIFKTALKQAEAELNDILAEEAAIEERRLELEKRTAKLTQNIGHLAALAEDDLLQAGMRQMAQKAGLTNAVIKALRASDRSLTVTEIKENIEKQGFSTAKYQSILATLHITLDRLSKTNGPVEQLRDERGKKIYRSNPNYSALKVALNSAEIRRMLQNSVKAVEKPKRSAGDIVVKALDDAIHPKKK